MDALNNTFKASLVSGTQETSLSLASINFDFSLVKFEAAEEYRGVGKTLSTRHRAAAETGSEHIFARRLGALFAQALPSTPNLIRAYGERASEIASEAKATPSKGRNSGIFSDWAGIDATSIWAAATSGPGAMPVHLLACMLARAWDAAEAVAIWQDLIESRKREISRSDSSDPLHLSTMAACQIEITRSQMASWDSSARSWLGVADECKKLKQKQLELLIQGSGLTVNHEKTAYSSVMKAWKSSMSTMENILSGMAHTVQDGSVLLGLLSWHLYPDMYVLRADPPHVLMNDRLIPPKAVVTLGISSNSPDSEKGVYWSLPLVYLRYYGDPIQRSSAMGDNSTRLTIPELCHVTLGSVFSSWSETGNDFEQACQVVIRLWKYFISMGCTALRGPKPWLQVLSETAEQYLASEGIQRRQLKDLIARGRRRYARFLAKPADHPGSFFGLSSRSGLLRLISNKENKIAFLRHLAKGFETGPESLIIRYSSSKDEIPYGDFNTQPLSEGEVLDTIGLWGIEKSFTLESQKPEERRRWAYATGIAKNGLSKKRKRESELNQTGHFRWAELSDISSIQAAFANGEFISYIETQGATEIGLHAFEWIGDTAVTKTKELEVEHDAMEVGVSNQGRREYESLIEFLVDNTILETRNEINRLRLKVGSQQLPDIQFYPKHIKFECVVGDPSEAALFQASGFKDPSADKTCAKDLLAALEAHWIDPYRLVVHLENLGTHYSHSNGGDFIESLRALAAAVDAYKLSPGATIIARSLAKPLLQDSSWTVQKEKNNEDRRFGFDKVPSNFLPTHLSAYALSKEQTFACIAMFENQVVNLDPRSLKEVIALSAGNSIFVSMPLICDPFEIPLENEIVRVMGNVGQPGVSLLIPPVSPRVRKTDEETWYPINHLQFDGELANNFRKTTLHLSFTQYKLPISIASHGDQAVEAAFLESLVSVFDNGEWVADLDVLGALSNPSLVRWHRTLGCSHKEGAVKVPDFPLISIDSWHEFLDRPLEAGIFRASGNLEARLAASVMAAQLGLRTILFQNEDAVCWPCAMLHYKLLTKDDLRLNPGEEKQPPLFIC